MEITSIKVAAGRTVPHPLESYSNFRAFVQLHGDLAPGDDADACTRQLQAKAEGLVDDHVESFLKIIHERDRDRRRQQELQTLERELQIAQQRVELARKTGVVAPKQIEGELVDEYRPQQCGGCGKDTRDCQCLAGREE